MIKANVFIAFARRLIGTFFGILFFAESIRIILPAEIFTIASEVMYTQYISECVCVCMYVSLYRTSSMFVYLRALSSLALA